MSLQIFLEQMEMLYDDYARYESGDPKVPFAVIRDSVVSALNEYNEVRNYLNELASTTVEQLRRVCQVAAQEQSAGGSSGNSLQDAPEASRDGSVLGLRDTRYAGESLG